MNMKHIKKLMAGTVLGTALIAAGPAMADDTQDLQAQIDALKAQLAALETALTEKADAKDENQGGDAIKVKWEPAPSIASPDGRFEMNLRGRIYADAGWVNDDDNTINAKGTEFRTARLGIEGKAWKDIKYKFEVDFAGNAVDIKDAYIQYKGAANVTVGQFKTPNSLEEQTSSRYITFMERASFTDAFSLARQLGLGVGMGGDNWTFNVGAFRGDAGTGNEDEGTTFAGRVTFGPQIGDNIQTHFGASFRTRKIGADQSDLRYRQRPHNHLSDRFVNTNRISDSDTFFGLEAAAIMDAVAIQGEYTWLKADLSSGFMAANPLLTTDPTFTGGYVDVSFFLTGESRAYDPKKGSFGRVKVDNPVFKGGMGAWQISARFDTIDLSDEGILGGKQDSYIFGVNWYLNRHTRMMLNYSVSDVDNGFLVGANGIDGSNKIKAFGLRAQVDW